MRCTALKVRADDDRSLLVKLADQMEEYLPARLGEAQISQFIEAGEVQARELIGDASLTAVSGSRCVA
jgi:hypothetical protein